MYPCKKEAYRDYTNKRRKLYKDRGRERGVIRPQVKE